MCRIVPALVLTLAWCPPPAHARLLPDWPYDKLLREADVVVVGRAASSADSGETTTDNPWKVEFVGIDTTFSVQAVLKGKVEGGPLKVLHYRLKRGVLVEDGPMLVAFRTKPVMFTTKEGKYSLGTPEYLLFLKRRKDGRYEPVSGTVDPSLSVREMYQPLDTSLGQD